MALYLVGENIDAHSAHRGARDEALIQIIRGIYIDADDDADAALRAHAVRVAHYLYPAAYLSAASAALLAPTLDGRLFLGGRRNQRTRLRGLEIIQVEAPSQPSLDKAIIGDPLGEFTIAISSPEQRMLEAFRLRSEQASAISEDQRRATAERLIAEYGSPQAAADILWALARANDWFKEGERAERYLRGSGTTLAPAINHAAFQLLVAWHGKPVGTLGHDGHEWRWSPRKEPAPPLIRATLPGTLPPFIESLLPEGWLAQVLRDEDQRAALRHGKRYMSNITIGADLSELKALPADTFDGTLHKLSRGGVFLGRYAGPDRGTLEESFAANLARIFEAGTTPRLSGVQIKAPMNLSRGGILSPATTLSFTHIFKPAGTSGFEQMPVVEWLCLELARQTGLETALASLVEMPDAMPPALIVERFDIRLNDRDTRRFALEDFCSILGVGAEDKYKGTIEHMARGLRPLSTAPREDVATLFSRALFAWLIADGDMHLKNVAMLKIAGPRARDFDTVRMAPIYDTLTTLVFPGLHNDHMALKLAGKDDRLRPHDFETLARTIDLPIRQARDIVAHMIDALRAAPARIILPDVVKTAPGARAAIEAVFAIVAARCSEIAGSGDQVG